MSQKVALITGGSRGIGLGIAKALAKLGYCLSINGVRDEDDVVDVITELKGLSPKVIYCQGDIGISADREHIVKRTQQYFDHINVLINNAGVAPLERNDLLNMSEASYDRVLDINLKGTFFLSQIVAKHIIDEKQLDPDYPAAIINISSISATVVSPNRGQYCISKAGMSMVTQLFAARLGAYKIPVYEVRPGLIETDMTARVKGKYNKLIGEGLTVQPIWGQPEDVGKAVASLVKGDFPYSTGQVIMVDGGLTMQRL